MWRRLKVTIWNYKAFVHLAYIIFVVVAITLSTWHCFSDAKHNTPRKKAVAILTHAGWPPVLWVVCMISCWAPIQYALAPPSMPHREELMTTDPTSGVSYPNAQARVTQISRWHTLHELGYSLISIYTCILFVLSFWM